jgi:hypothetical protein
MNDRSENVAVSTDDVAEEGLTEKLRAIDAVRLAGGGWPVSSARVCSAADEIDRLRTAARLAISELEIFEREMQGIAPEAVSKALPALRAVTCDLDLALTRGEEVRELRAEIERLQAQNQRLQTQNQALRNLANNLRPGPISEAFGGIEHERPYREAVEPQSRAGEPETAETADIPATQESGLAATRSRRQIDGAALAHRETCPSCGKEHNRQCDDGWHI